RVSGNHWGMFVLVEEDFSELSCLINQAKKVGQAKLLNNQQKKKQKKRGSNKSSG
ncbi:40404_t:CDS:2, partial [Gigaspora margarita]